MDGYIRPVALWNSQKKIWQNVEFAFQKHRLTVSKSLLFGNPQHSVIRAGGRYESGGSVADEAGVRCQRASSMIFIGRSK